MIYTTHNPYYNNLKNLKILAPANYWHTQNIDVSKTLAHTKTKASTNYWRRQNIGVKKHKRPQILVQEVGGDAEELPYC
jgi:hypothetical protein